MPIAEISKPCTDVFGPTFRDKNFPNEMRLQLWPLCCGFSILSGFKDIYPLTREELTEQIKHICDETVPDFQVFHWEEIRPVTTFLTLNEEQMDSPKIMDCVAAAGFVKIGEACPRETRQGLFIRDKSKTWVPA